MAEAAADKVGTSGDEEDQFFAAYQRRKEEANRRFAAETLALEAAERGSADTSPSPAVRPIPDETVMLPLTPAMRDIIRRRARMYAIWGAVATIAFSLFMLILHALVGRNAAPGSASAPAWFWPCMAAITMILPITFGWKVFSVTIDLRSGQFLRSQGHMRVSHVTLPSQNGPNRIYTLHVGDSSFVVQPEVARAADGLAYGSVDYSQRAHEVFELRDRDGAMRYRLPRYDPDAS